MGGCVTWKYINVKELKMHFFAQTFQVVEGSKIEYSKCMNCNFANTENKTSLSNTKCSGHFSPTFFFLLLSFFLSLISGEEINKYLLND